MQIKHVKVTKVGSRNYWYADKIGQEFHVFDVGGDPDDRFRHKVIQTGTFESHPVPMRYLDDEDFEVIEAFDGDVVEQLTISVRRRDHGDVGDVAGAET